MLDLAFQPDRTAAAPIYRQLEGYLRELIEARRLVPGERLPPSRQLAASLGLARNTVNQAYQSLTEDGLLRSHVGQGTFVAGWHRAGLRPVRGENPAVRRGFVWGGLFARRVRSVTLPRAFRSPASQRPALQGPPETDIRFDMRAGQVDLASLPGAELKRAFGRALGQLGALAAAEDPRGWPPLREGIARALMARGIACDPDEVAVVNGAQHALDLVARVLVDPGDTVVVEQPGYFGAALAFAASEAHVVGVGVDAEGMRTDELARILRARRVKIVYTTPAVQSPTGVSLSDSRRRQLLQLADEYQVPLVEDDYDSELRCGGPPIPALKNLDAAGQVIYLGTFSKALFAGLRSGYLVAPAPLLWRLVLSRWAADFGSDLVTQAALAELIADGGLERHVRRVRRLYTERRAAMLEALALHLPGDAAWTPPAGGNAVWITLPPEVDPEELAAAAREEGIAFSPGGLFYLGEGGSHQLALSFARLAPDRIAKGIEKLGVMVRLARRAGHRQA